MTNMSKHFFIRNKKQHSKIQRLIFKINIQTSRQIIIIKHLNTNSLKHSQMPQQPKDLKTMPVRQYLDNTVVPVILQALTELAKQRPEQPLKFVADYLSKHAEGENGKKTNKNDD